MPNSYGKFGESFHMDPEKFSRATQLLWDYLHLRLKQRNFRKFHWQKVNRFTRRVTLRIAPVQEVEPLRTIYNIRLPERVVEEVAA